MTEFAGDRATGSVTLRGIPGSPGVAVGPAFVISNLRAQQHPRRTVQSGEEAAEVQRFRAAIVLAKDTLREVSARITGPAVDTTAILEAYLLMLGDPLLTSKVESKILAERKCVEWAVASAAEEIAHAFGDPADRDAYIVERRHDVHFVCDRLLRALAGPSAIAAPRFDQPTIVVGHDLSPADTAGMVKEPVRGFITEVGSRTSHTSIMARALEIPAVVGASAALAHIRTGDIVIVDGLAGTITINPTEEELRVALGRAQRHLNFAKELLSSKDELPRTRCGVPIQIKANVELPAEAILAVDHGAQGVGLYRTEFLYIDRASMPTEDEQYQVYRAVLEALSPRPVTLRTFDIGGDKFASSFQLPAELNPALGLRAIRLALSQPEVFLTQLRAMVRASAHGDLRIMVPMVTIVPEMRAVRKLLDQAIADVKKAGHAQAAKIPLGMMIEVPAAALMVDVFATVAEFFSLGTNDLVQYALAIDRSNESLAQLASPLDPSILRLISGVVQGSSRHDVPLSICGAMASDPLAACLLVGLGLRELSMEAAAIPEIKEALRRVTLSEVRALAEKALTCESSEDVLLAVHGALGERMADLLAGVTEEVS